MSDYASYGLDTVKKTHDEGSVGSSYCPWCLDANVSKGFSMCFSNWCICPSCVWLAHTDSVRKNKDFWNEEYECYKCGKKNVLCFISPTKGITLGICVDCIQWAHDVLSKQSNQQKKSMPTLEESLLKCKVEGCVVYLPPISEGPLENYQEVRKALLNAGAKYKRNTFVFPNEAQLYIDRLVSGESVNIKKEFQFFATPKEIAEMMISYLPPVADDAKVLEPSAGDGALIKAFHAAYPNIEVECFEIMDINIKALQSLEKVNRIGSDFLDSTESGKLDNHYDIIIANPPFTKNQDIDHINRMYQVLKPGGTLITLASPSWTFGSQKKQTEFKEWLEKLDVFPKTLPQKSFASSGTNITPVLLQIQKPVIIVSASSEGVVSGAVIPGPNKLDTSSHREPKEILNDLKQINKEIEQGVEQLEEMITTEKPVRKCRVCGCTENDCRQCIEKTGEPCYWVDEDLCSACVDEVEKEQEQVSDVLPPAQIETEIESPEVEETPVVESDGVPDTYLDYLDNRNSSSITFTEMKFFEQLKAVGKDVHLSIDIKEKNGKYTVMILPKASDGSRIQPIVVTGTSEELDEGFFNKVGPVLVDSCMQLRNVEEHKKSVTEAARTSEKKVTPPATSSDKKPEKKGPAAAAKKKNADKKPIQKEEAQSEETPKVEEQALF